MKKYSHKHLLTACLLMAIFLGLQSCDEPGVGLEKSKVQFNLDPLNSSQGRSSVSELPENATLRLRIESNSGTTIIDDQEIKIYRSGHAYQASPVDLFPGSYVVTDFIVTTEDEVVNAAPKARSELSNLVMNTLPFTFTVTENGVAQVNMQVLDARNHKPQDFGYASFKFKRSNKLSFLVDNKKGGQSSFKKATAELRQGKQVIKTFSAKPGLNNVAFEGDPNAMYTLSVYAGETAASETFSYRTLKKKVGNKPLRLTLEPALILTIESSLEEGGEYEESFEFFLDGTHGNVNINWGDGTETSSSLPFSGGHEYTTGNYTAIITGDLNQITDLHGFSYSTIIYGINGLTNLTSLKTYNPSWGAVPIKVDLSNSRKLETIYVEKYGAPYETIDLRKDFQLPGDHFIKVFVFNAPSFDINRENISAQELKYFVDNIYNNTRRRSIYDGKFYVYPVDTPLPETQAKLDILQKEYNWDVRLDGNFWDDASESGRSRNDLNVRREKWLKEKFPEKKHLFKRSAGVEYAF